MPDCQARTQSKGPYYPSYGLRPGGGPCERQATYTDGKGNFYCTQHAKQPATVMHKATGRIRDGFRRIQEGN